MKATKVTHSSCGSYYEGGYRYPASAGSVSMLVREDGMVRYEHHYYANLGDMKQEITRDQYFKMLGDILATEGTKHPKYGCEMRVWMSTSTVDVYESDWKDPQPLNPYQRRR
jgi:hypothetical protein